jgi:predicted N-acetyltransferase YhbS
MNDVEIRAEHPGDEHAIHEVTAAAFHAAPHTSHTEQFIVRELRRAGALTVSLVAETDGRVVGHVAISPVTIDGTACGWFGLGPLSVLPGRQGAGIGSRLVREALARLRAAGARGCVLVGEPAYYGRFGFRAEPALVLPDVPAEYFQAVSFVHDLPHGDVAFHPAFATTS